MVEAMHPFAPPDEQQGGSFPSSHIHLIGVPFAPPLSPCIHLVVSLVV